MNVTVKLKVQWHWYGEKLADLCKRKLDFEVTLDDVIGVDNVAVVEVLTVGILCQKP
jgi:hypothetical protein